MISDNDIKRSITERILGKDDEAALIRNFVHHFRLEQPILNLTNYQEAWFYPAQNKIKMIHKPEVERISMVMPVSYHFCAVLRLEGHFKVKYSHIAVHLPKIPEPFFVRYTGIVVPEDEKLIYRNEMLELVI